jgi:hypothetical protein
MNSNQSKISFKDSLKSWDTENFLDRIFYRPIGFRIALLLKSTPVTPNLVTIISIFVGIGGCLLFYPDDYLLINMVGFALLVCANILDCVDGQLARITGIKSEIGRILDGFGGDLWFLTFYIIMVIRLMTGSGWGWWTILIALASASSHLYQAGMVDYYKTFHLHFIKGGKNSEFQDSASIRAQSRAYKWKKNPDKKIFFKLYYVYTLIQEMKTPQLRSYNNNMLATYPDGFPDDKIAAFRERSIKSMPLLNTFTFNSRSIVMLVTLLLNLEWLYFAVEILIFNPLLVIAIVRHEKMCKELNV